jgi:hypothetical protein
MTALKAMTIWPAWQHFEEDLKGSIEVGKLADFVILSDDPTRVEPETLARIDVLVTIKNDAVIYEDKEGGRQGGMPASVMLFGGKSPDAAHHFLHAMYEAIGHD